MLSLAPCDWSAPCCEAANHTCISSDGDASRSFDNFKSSRCLRMSAAKRRRPPCTASARERQCRRKNRSGVSGWHSWARSSHRPSSPSTPTAGHSRRCSRFRRRTRTAFMFLPCWGEEGARVFSYVAAAFTGITFKGLPWAPFRPRPTGVSWALKPLARNEAPGRRVSWGRAGPQHVMAGGQLLSAQVGHATARSRSCTWWSWRSKCSTTSTGHRRRPKSQ